MIAKLRGRLDSVGEDWAVVDASGVGYLLYCSARTLRALPKIGDVVEFFVDTHVREDHIHLYGFGAASEREWFTLLQTVQGVGARVALGLLSTLGPEDLTEAIAARDRVPLTRANGIGPKVADRILAELKDKVSALSLEPSSQHATLERKGVGNISADAISALVNLGYGRSEAFRAIGSVQRSLANDEDLPSLIRASLKELGQ